MSYLAAIFTSLISLLCLIKFSDCIKIVDKPNSRSSHQHPLPRTGGVSIALGLIPTLMVFYPYHLGFFTISAIIIVFIVGLFDDMWGLSAYIKLFFILIAVILLSLDGLVIESLGQFFEWNLSLGWLALPFTILAIGGITNGLNLIDGLDGLASGISITILIAFAYIGYKFQDAVILTFSLLLIFTQIPFLLFNFNPAKIFMGDSGSLTLGFSMGILSVLSIKYIHPAVILYLYAVPIIDTLVVMFRRIFNRQNPFSADKNHIHHILFHLFKSVRVTVIIIILIQTLFCFIGYVVARQIELYPMGLLPLATVVSFFILLVLNYIIFTNLLTQKSGDC